MHLKRTSMPISWPMARKEEVWAVSQETGPHQKSASMPIGVVLRDALKLTASLKETKKILNERKIKVNGIPRTDYRFPVGYFDIIEIPDSKKVFRVVPSHHGFGFEETKDTTVLSRITNKSATRGGKIQYTTHNGRTLLAENKYKVGDTLKLGTDGKITGHIALRAGEGAVVLKGKLRGTSGKITDAGPKIRLETADGNVETIREYIFVTGEK